MIEIYKLSSQMARDQVEVEVADIVTITSKELASGTCREKTWQAFGPAGLGILLVADISGLDKLRSRALEQSGIFASMPDEKKKKYEDPQGGLAGVGWSHGSEALEDGTPDFSKGSFYANLRTTLNVWPDEDLPDFSSAVQKLGDLIIEVGLLVTRLCDLYVKSKLPDFPDGKLEKVLKESTTAKARVLHYFPQMPHADLHAGKWCGQHTDHGSLTGLVPGMYTREGKEVSNPDPASGLYIVDRNGRSVKVVIPPSHLAFQVGEAMQVHSGGLLRATPHYVQAPSGPNAVGVARETMAVFMQPGSDERMDLPPGADASSVGIGQWVENINFGEFSKLTVEKNFSPTA